MAETNTKVAVKESAATTPSWPQFDVFWRRQFEQFLNQFPHAWRAPSLLPRADLEPFWLQGSTGWGLSPAMDLVEKDDAYEVTAELPGLTDNSIDVKYADGLLTIKGEKQDSKEEKKTDYHLSERRFGSFRRSFNLPAGIDTDKIEAHMNNGVLTVKIPKTAEAVRREKKIPISQSK